MLTSSLERAKALRTYVVRRGYYPTLKGLARLLLSITWFCAYSAAADDAKPDRSGVRPEVLTLPGAPGSVKGLGEAQDPNVQMASARYRVPIALNPGAGGFGPSLSLDYASGAGSGELGVGWALGTPVLRRNTDKGLPRYRAGDTLELSGFGATTAGGDLVQLTDGSYRYRIEGAFVRGVKLADDRFEFRLPNGTTGTFGGAPSALVRSEGQIFAWYLTELKDPYGNKVRYEYEQDATRRPYLARMVWDDFSSAVRQEVRFTYEGRPDAHTSYLATFAVTTARRLAKVEVVYGGQVVRTYALGYSEALGLSRLQTVGVTARDGTTLPSLQFAYSGANLSSGALTTMQNGPTRPLGVNSELDDVDGDGLPDLLLTDPSLDGGKYSWFANLDGTQFAAREPISSSPSVWLASHGMQLADMNGDGAADVLAEVSENSDGLRYYPGGAASGGVSAPATGFGSAVVVSPRPSFGLEDQDTRLIDLNHDGLTDWLRIEPSSGELRVALNQGSGSFSESVLRPRLEQDEKVTFTTGAKAQLADMNGDGLVDIVQLRAGAARYWPSKGFGYFDAAVSLVGAPQLSDGELKDAQLSDVTGDGLADLIHVGISRVRIWANGAGYALLGVVELTGVPERAAETAVRVADMNGNGTRDIVWFNRSDAANAWRYLDVLPEGPPSLIMQAQNGLGEVRSFHYVGAGAMRRMVRDVGLAWTYRSAVSQSLLAELQVSDSLGTTQVMQLIYTDGYFDVRQREFRGFARAVETDEGDSEQPSLVTEYFFDVGRDDEARAGQTLRRLRRGLDGLVFDESAYSYVTRVLATGEGGQSVLYAYANVEEQRVVERAPAVASIRIERTRDDYGNVTREAHLGLVASFGLLSAEGDERIVERSFAINTAAWVVDRPSAERVLGGDGVLQSERRIYYDGPALEGLPLGQVERGKVSREEAWVEGGRYAQVQRSAYDTFGNLMTKVDARGGRIDIAYDDQAHRFITHVRRHTREDGQGEPLEWQAEYEPGLAALTGLVDPNQARTAWAYDGLGRLTTVVKPGDSSDLPTQRFSYHLGAPRSMIRIEQRAESGGTRVHVSAKHFDGLGRELGTLVQAEGGRWAASKVVAYGVRGLARFEQLPFFTRSGDAPPPDLNAAGEWFAYDALGRALSQRHADGSEVRTEYRPLEQVSFDELDTLAGAPQGLTPTSHVRDGLGRLRAVVERDGVRDLITRYTYDARDNLIGFSDSRGVSRQYVYNGLSHRTRIDDPNAGHWEFTYDDAGSVLERLDPTGSRVRYTYDALGRMLTEKHQLPGASETTAASFHYDVASGDHSELAYQRGQLSFVTDAGGSAYFGYDARGRITTQIRRFSDGDEYQTTNAFDAADRLVMRTFPDGSSLPYAYDTRGLLASMGPVITSLAWTAQGSLERVIYGNGVTDRREYDARQRLTRMSASIGGVASADARGRGVDIGASAPSISGDTQPKAAAATTLRDLAFTLDPASRIAALRDMRASTQADPALDLSARYTYDTLHRLASAEDRLKRTEYAYDDVANLLSLTRTALQSAGGTGGAAALPLALPSTQFAYAEGGSAPDQLTSAVTDGAREAFVYDAAGRTTKDGTRTLTWDAKGRLSRVERTDGQGATIVEEYVYGFDDQRLEKRTVRASKRDVVRYLDDDIEVRAGTLIRYARLGDERVVRLDALEPSNVAPLSGAVAGILAQLWRSPNQAQSTSIALSLLLVLLLLALSRVRDLGLVGAARAMATPLGSGPKLLPTLALPLAALALFSCGDSSSIKPSHPITEWPKDAVLYLSDHQQSPVALIDAEGALLEETAYDPYGIVRKHAALQSTAASSSDPFRYVGNEADAGSTLSDFHARPYRPELARFLAPDPEPLFAPGRVTQAPASYQAYTYAAADPINHDDRSGRSIWTKLAKVAVKVLKGADMAATLHDAVQDAVTAVDPSAKPLDRVVAAASLASEALPVSVGDAKDVAKYAKKGFDKVKDGLQRALRSGDKLDGATHAAKRLDHAPGAGQKVYRVYGGDARPDGASWTPVDPRSVDNFRDAAGLPSGGASGATNSGRFVIEGTLTDPSKVVKSSPAAPLDGKTGGLPEYTIPDPFGSGAVSIDNVSGVNPEF